MRALRAWLLRVIGAMARHRERDVELADELDSHLQLHIDDQMRAGVPRAEARRRALVALGGVEATREAYRDCSRFRVLDHTTRDIRHGLRQLRSGPSATAVIMIAVAIGLTTAMFAVADALVLRPVPFPGADRLEWFAMFNTGGGRETVAPAVLRAWREHPAFVAAEGVSYASAVIDAGSGPTMRSAVYVSAGLFDMLGVQAVRGRLFGPGGARHQAADEVAILSGPLARRVPVRSEHHRSSIRLQPGARADRRRCPWGLSLSSLGHASLETARFRGPGSCVGQLAPCVSETCERRPGERRVADRDGPCASGRSLDADAPRGCASNRRRRHGAVLPRCHAAAHGRRGSGISHALRERELSAAREVRRKTTPVPSLLGAGRLARATAGPGRDRGGHRRRYRWRRGCGPGGLARRARSGRPPRCVSVPDAAPAADRRSIARDRLRAQRCGHDDHRTAAGLDRDARRSGTRPEGGRAHEHGHARRALADAHAPHGRGDACVRAPRRRRPARPIVPEPREYGSRIRSARPHDAANAVRRAEGQPTGGRIRG